MESCELYTQGRAFDNEYKGDLNIVLCEIGLIKCPYGNSGEEIMCADKKTRIICKSNGLVEKAGLFDAENLLEDLTEAEEGRRVIIAISELENLSGISLGF